jgi:hypothetical protein
MCHALYCLDTKRKSTERGQVNKVAKICLQIINLYALVISWPRWSHLSKPGGVCPWLAGTKNFVYAIYPWYQINLKHIDVTSCIEWVRHHQRSMAYILYCTMLLPPYCKDNRVNLIFHGPLMKIQPVDFTSLSEVHYIRHHMLNLECLPSHSSELFISICIVQDQGWRALLVYAALSARAQHKLGSWYVLKVASIQMHGLHHPRKLSRFMLW